MADRAAIVTGASSGIGLAIARTLGEEGFALTLVARRAEKLSRAALEVVNTTSIAGRRPQAWLAVYSATKAGVIGYTQAMNRELNADGVKSVALCPGFVATPMTDFVREHVKAEDMIQPTDIAEAVRWLLKVSPACVIPEIVFQRPEESGG